MSGSGIDHACDLCIMMPPSMPQPTFARTGTRRPGGDTKPTRTSLSHPGHQISKAFGFSPLRSFLSDVSGHHASCHISQPFRAFGDNATKHNPHRELKRRHDTLVPKAVPYKPSYITVV